MKFLYSITLKSVSRSCTLNGISLIGHLENIGSLSYIGLPNVDTFVIQYKKITFVNITTNLKTKKSLSAGSCQAQNGRYFHNPNFHLEP